MDPGQPAAGDRTSDPAGGDPAAGGPTSDPAGGDPAAGGPTSDPAGDDPAAGGPTSDPAGGDPAAGGPTSDPAGGDPAAGGPTSDPAGGDPAAGDLTSDAAGGQDLLVLLPALQTLWSSRELRQLREEVWQGFAALDDPRAALLALLEGSGGWRAKGPSLEAWVTRELEHWLRARPPPGAAQPPGPPCPAPYPWPRTPPPAAAGPQNSRGRRALRRLQARALSILAETPSSLVEPLVRIFQLQDVDRGALLAHVLRLHQEGRFKEAITLATKLGLQPELDVEKMGTPLLLQGKLDLVERFVDGCPGLQRRLLALLDSWCRPGFKIRFFARQYPQVTCPRLEKLSPQVLARQALRLLERYGLDPATCPNAVSQQRLAALRYLCYKRFVEGSLSRENWADHVRGLVGQSQWLQGQLLQLLASHADVAAVAQCALDLSLPEEQLPGLVAAELSRLRLQERTAEAPSEDTSDRYYQLPIAREDVLFLASWAALARHEEQLLQPGQVVGVDLEWRPSFGTGARPRASLLQVAVRGRVFLLDLPALTQPAGGQAAQAFSRLVARLLSDPSITKLGYELAGDLKSLGASCPALAHVQKQLQGDLDLLQVHRQMRETETPAPGVDRARGPRGLSLLVQQVLGKPLDKTQQLSNWDRRPLDEGQLLYAAADAYCLLEVYWALCREPARFHLADSPRPGHCRIQAPAPPQQVPVAVGTDAAGTDTAGTDATGTDTAGTDAAGAGAAAEETVGEDAAPEVPARAFRVVCDNMLQGLARSLRCLGADALVLGPGEDHRQAAEVARQEGRIILTAGLPYHQLRAQVGEGRCLRVDCALRAPQQAKAVLRHFNVRVSPADVFSRCQACNCDQYLKVPKGLMKQLVGLSGRQEASSSLGDEGQSEDTQEPGSAPEETLVGCTYDPPCRWLEEADLRARVPATLSNGTRLQLAGVPAGVLRRPGLRHFYCCAGCGKVFWEGSHLGRVVSQFLDILHGAPGPAPSPS